ncbi:MAG TPA: hypothetical protein PK566_08225 [Pseudobacteroides sp.]|nr:hypothetical protein [Pseudobacteroides sp.]
MAKEILKRVEQSKEAYKRAEKIAKQSEYYDKTVASNGKITLSGFDGKTKISGQWGRRKFFCLSCRETVISFNL